MPAGTSRPRRACPGPDQYKLEAEKIYQWTLEGLEKAWGPGRTSTLNTVNNLRSLCKHQDQLGEAKKMFQRALQGYEKGPRSYIDTRHG
jgi:hypothetical protein